MISDDDVLRLFEQADPARRPDRTNDHVAGAGFLAAQQQQRSIDMTITETPQTEAQSPRRPRWGLMGAAAAVVALVVGLVAVATRDTEPSAPAATPPAPTTPTTLPAPTTQPDPTAQPSEVEIAEQFYVALNDRDLATLQSLMGSDGVYDENIVVEDMPAHVAALEAWGWTWEEVACEPAPEAGVRCEIAVRNRLTELTGAELSGSSLVTVTDGEIERVNHDGLDFSEYGPNAMQPFETWLQDNHLDDHRTIWGGEDGALGLTPESAALLDQRLTDYASEVRSDADAVGSRDDGTGWVQLGGLDSSGLRPLASVSAGDVLIPTAPSGWYLETPLRGDAGSADLPVPTIQVATDRTGNRRLEGYLAPACATDATTCPLADNGYQIPWPVPDEIVLDGVVWGYPGGAPGGSVATVIGDHVVAVAVTWYESTTPALDDPDVVALLEGLRVASMAELPEQVSVVDEFGRPADPSTGELPAPPETQVVASTDVRGTTVVLDAAPVDDEICLSLDRADNGETIWPSGCIVASDVDETLVIDVAQLGAGPRFSGLGERLEYLLVGYVAAPSAVDVRASFDGVSVDGRSATPTDIADGVFVLMSVNELDDVIDFEGGFDAAMIELEIIEPSD